MFSRLRGRNSGGGNDDQSSNNDRSNRQRRSEENSTPVPGIPWARSSSRGSRRISRNPPDPFKLHGPLFEYLTHVQQHGEAFAGYLVKGNPMVLLSLVDGTALASIHVMVVGDEGRALVARQSADGSTFQGVLAAEGQSFELVLLNLTTDAVLMMDVGGELRHFEPAYWEKNDKEFWSGRHRNDMRLNRSNILWPMMPNVCEENNIHYQQTSVSRRLTLQTQSSIQGVGNSGQGPAGFPIFVYPEYGSRASARFERTMWACPETIVVIGSPQLVGDTQEAYNIQRDNPLNRTKRRSQPQAGVVGALADSLGVTADRLLEVAQVDKEFVAQIPDEMAHELLMQQLDEQKLKLLLEEGADDTPPSRTTSSVPTLPNASASAPSSSSSGRIENVVAGATPAAVVAGERMLRLGGHSLLIEKFDFERCSKPASLSFGVYDRLQKLDDAVSDEDVASLREDLRNKINELRSGRREALLEQVKSVYQTPDCVICMSENPDTVLYQCGHRCVHFKCIEKSGLRRCPLCRAPIVAMLPDIGAARASGSGFL